MTRARCTPFGIDLGDIDMGAVEALGVGAGWGRVAPGRHVRSAPARRDRDVRDRLRHRRDRRRRQAHAGAARAWCSSSSRSRRTTSTTHGDADLLFATFYWRDADAGRAGRAAGPDRRRFADRPVFVFSTPPTPNGDLHIGHLSGPYLGADVFVRFQRMNGTRAWHLAGSDDFQSYVAECAAPGGHDARRGRRALQRRDRRDAPADGHRASTSTPSPSRNDGYQDGAAGFFARLVGSGRGQPPRADAGAVRRPRPATTSTRSTSAAAARPAAAATGGNICEECGEPNFCVDLVEPRPAAGTAEPQPGTITRYTLPLHELRAEVARAPPSRPGSGPGAGAGAPGVRPGPARHRAHPPVGWGVAARRARTCPARSSGSGSSWPIGFIYGIEALGRKLGQDWRADAPQDDWKIVHFLGYDNTLLPLAALPGAVQDREPGWTPDIDYHVNEFYLLDGEQVLHQPPARDLGQGHPRPGHASTASGSTWPDPPGDAAAPTSSRGLRADVERHARRHAGSAG